MYLAHNITMSQGGQIIGLFDNYESTKKLLQDTCHFGANTTDWGHFIRWYEPGQVMEGGVLGLPRVDKDGKSEERSKVDGHVALPSA